MTTRTRFIISLGVVALGLGVWRWQQPATAPEVQRPVPVPVVAPAGAVPEVASAEPPCRFNVGGLMAFDITATTQVRSDEGAAKFTFDKAAAGRSTARLTFEVLRVDTSSAVLLARGTSLTGAFDRTLEGADAPWLVRVNERCEVAGFARQKNTSRRIARLQQSLASELWFTLPAHQGPAMVAFDTSVGRASGMIMPAGGPTGHRFVRTIQRYENVWSQAMNGVEVVRSRMEIRRGAGVWFDSIEGVEEFSVPGIITSATASMQVSSVPPDSTVLASGSREDEHYVWGNTFEEVPDQSVRAWVAPDHQERVEAMRSVSYPQALEGMLSTFSRTDNLHEQTRDMAAFLDAHPEQIHEYAGAVLTEFEPEWKPAGFLALARTQNAAAREVLFDVWREREAPEMDRIRASVALVTRRDVGAPLAREMLVEAKRAGTPAQRNVSQQALLHVGMLAGLRPDDEEIRSVVGVGLAAELPGRQTLAERAPLYSAIGNTGDVTFLPELERASRNPDAEWRAIVPIGMRRMPVEAVRDFTLDWLRRETSPLVMRELFEVVQHQYQDVGRVVDDELTVEAVNYLRRQPRILTRQSILQLLRPLVATNEDVRAAFREQLKIEYEADSGMFPYVALCLPQEDVTTVLATIPSLADQHRGAPPVRLPVMAPPPAPTPITSDMLPRVDVPDRWLP